MSSPNDVSGKYVWVERDQPIPSDLHMAAKNGHYETVQYLLEKENTDVNLKNPQGKTALMMASLGNKVEIIELLLQVSPIAFVFHFLVCSTLLILKIGLKSMAPC